ncbi:SseB family protein, partial [Actinomadura soli]
MATVADAWRPTSDLEHRLEETVRAGDQESYFRILAESELVVPVPPDVVDGVLANETQPSWPTQEEDGRVHVLVYTSAAAMRACLGQSYQHFMTVRFGDIAETWPDDRWWLAVDVPAPGRGTVLPIEARLPSWFVRQVAAGDGRPPQVGRASAPWEELRDQHRDLPRETPAESPRQEFQPANDVERDLLRAAANNDHDLFLQTLAATDVLLPVPDDTDYTLRPGRPGFPWQTREVDGSTVVPVFTSPERLIEAAHAAGTGTEYIKLPFTVALRYWPDHDWLLAINSGSPAGGTILAQQLPGLATWADQRAAQRMTDGFDPQNDIEQRLFDAARRRDTDTFFSILLGAQVLVSADPETPWGIDPGDPGFPWRPVPVHGRTSIQIFTSLKWMNEAIGSSRFVMPSLVDMVAAWPDTGWTLVLNPGTPIDATMPGDQVRSLRGPDAAATPPSASTPPPPDTPAVPV